MYVAVKGGETAIAHSLDYVADKRRGDRSLAELSLEQIDQQLGLAVDRVMTEGSCYDRSLAALAIKQARGDLIEAIFLLRAYRTTLPRFGESLPLDTASMVAERRISSTFKDVPGGQVLGPTYDYTHRLLDFSLAAAGERPAAATAPADTGRSLPRVGDILEREGMLEPPPQEAAGGGLVQPASFFQPRHEPPVVFKRQLRGQFLAARCASNFQRWARLRRRLLVAQLLRQLQPRQSRRRKERSQQVVPVLFRRFNRPTFVQV